MTTVAPGDTSGGEPKNSIGIKKLATVQSAQCYVDVVVVAGGSHFFVAAQPALVLRQADSPIRTEVTE